MSNLRHVRILKRGDRGFHGYGKSFKDSYGTEVSVYESSSAEGPHVWVNPVWGPGGANAMHLNPQQARELIRRLETWLDEIPRRCPAGPSRQG